MKCAPAIGQSYGVPADIDEDDLMGELDALEEDMAFETESGAASGMPSYLQVRHYTYVYVEHASGPVSPCSQSI